MLTKANAQQKLAAYIGKTPARPRVPPAAVLPGAPSATITQHPSSSSINAAAAANLPVGQQRRDYSAYQIATNGCLQVARTLVEHGANDSRNYWLLGIVNLSVHCSDGVTFVHDASSGWPGYLASDVDNHFQQAEQDRQIKSLGAPSCATFNVNKKDICPHCPHWGNLKSGSPYSLGVLDFDLPFGYQRDDGWIKRNDKHIQRGYFTIPRLYRLDNGYRISFTYQHSTTEASKLVYFDEVDMPVGSRAPQYFASQHVTVQDKASKNFREFIVAWIDKLRSTSIVRHTHTEPFGWVRDENHAILGLAIAGTFYRAIGGTEEIAGGNTNVNHIYRPYPTSNRQAWTEAVNQIIPNRFDIQALIAVSFASPLIEFSPINGMAISAWSPGTGTGKTASARIGQSVWGDINAGLSYTNDTVTSVGIFLSKTRIMPRYWDEARFISSEEIHKFVELLFVADRGRDKMRATRDGSNIRPPAEWRTLSVLTGNMSLLGVVAQQSDSTDAGLARLFEFEMQRAQLNVPGRLHAPIADNIGTAGREYATWLASNSSRIRDDYAKLETQLLSVIGDYEQERFYRATIICMLLGAAYAKGLGLVDFDIQGLRTFLTQTLFGLRKMRQLSSTLARGKQHDVLIILQNFISDSAPWRATFSTFKLGRGGNSNIGVVILLPPMTNTRKLAVQVGNDIKIMRIDWETFAEWCHKKRYSPQNLFDLMQIRWGATKGRMSMGAPPNATSPIANAVERTPAAATTTCIELSLHYPEFEEYLSEPPPPIRGKKPAPGMRTPRGAPP